MRTLFLTIWKYLRPLWEGKDGKPSIKRVLAIAFSIDMIRNTSFAITKWEIGKSYADVAMLLGIEAGLVAALLGLTSYFSLKERELDHSAGLTTQGGTE